MHSPIRSRLMGAERATSLLDAEHYLGSKGARSRLLVELPGAVLTFSGPSSRRLPTDWLELSRWCIVEGIGSQIWRAALPAVRAAFPLATTVVSYSDPSVGHDGALYRASGWIWAPTWHVLRPPPTGAGIRGGKRQAAKHRWIYPLAPDETRSLFLTVNDAALIRRFPYAEFREPTWRRGVYTDERAGAFRRWCEETGTTYRRPDLDGDTVPA